MMVWLLPLWVLWGIGVMLWLVSLRIRDASLIDPIWGLLFVVIASIAFAEGGGLTERKLLGLGMTLIWGVRLFVHLYRRRRGHGEDHRYRDMRQRHGARWPWLSLPYVFLLQPLLAWCVALPLQAALRLGGSAPLSIWDALGALLFAVGFGFEVIADRQLTSFRASSESRNKVLDSGLFRYSRHPNYFGDALLWWGFGCMGVATGAWWALVGPLVMTFLLVRVSGVQLLERTIADRRPDYESYKQRTSAFLPWPPRTKKSETSSQG